jgi:hydroxymethylglutaryl-CoA synthase
MSVGIDRINYYVPKTYLDLETLATARHVDVAKYKRGLGQEKMSIPQMHEDIVTMAAEASAPILEDPHAIDMVFFATESGVDFSKAAGIYLHKLLNLKSNTKVIELKQACYALTSALHLGIDYVKSHPGHTALVVSSDVAWYGLNTPGEVTQGAGAIAMTISENPRLATVSQGQTYTEDVPDFYRPNTMEIPIVDGKFSIDCYITALNATYQKGNYPYICFHMPFAKMADKANASLTSGAMDETALSVIKSVSKEVGNIYNGSLYLALIGVLIQHPKGLENQTLGMYSYGSGSIGEFYTLTFTKDYAKVNDVARYQETLDSRDALSIEAYETAMQHYVKREQSLNYEALITNASYALVAIKNGHRLYHSL